MTREEAIKIFRKDIECMSHSKCSDCILEKVCDPMSTTPLDSEYIEAFGMAIKALEQEPCEDAISRAAAIKAMDDLEQEDIERYGCSIPEGFDGQRAIEALQSLPSVTPKPKVGRWEWVPYDDYPNIGNWHCSECRTIIPHMPKGTDNTPTYKWCPMCGAKMSENPTGSNCTDCVLDGTDACSRGAGRAVDGRACEDFVGESEEEIGPDKKG